MSSDHDFRRLLIAHRVSYTKQRYAVFSVLKGNEPLDVATLVSRLRHLMDRASVYRTIRLFEQIGLVQRIYNGWKYRLELSDMFQTHHHHMTCLRCGTIYSVHNEPTIERAIQQIASNELFILTGHTLELQGYCHSCHTSSV